MPLTRSTLTLSPLKTGRFLRAHRVVRRTDYLRIQECGRRIRTPHFVFMVMPRMGQQRIGITVTSKIGCAVRRNRIKRVTREVFRRNRELFPNDCETVVVARLGAHRLGYQDVLEELQGAQRAFAEFTRHTNHAAAGD